MIHHASSRYNTHMWAKKIQSIFVLELRKRGEYRGTRKRTVEAGQVIVGIIKRVVGRVISVLPVLSPRWSTHD